MNTTTNDYMELADKLDLVATALSSRFGRNPDSDLIRVGAESIRKLTAEAAPQAAVKVKGKV